MPLYEYECLQCGARFEEIRKFSDPPLTEHEQCGGKLRKLLSPPAIRFKGTGWYVTDYAKKSGDGSSDTKKDGGDEKTEKAAKADKSAASSSDTKTAPSPTKT